jgi:hypothetical protein
MQSIAEDYAAINARLEEIKRERLQAPAEYEMQTAVNNYLAGDGNEPAETKTYMGWDIYAPVNVTSALYGPIIPLTLPEGVKRMAIGTVKMPNGEVVTYRDWAEYPV